MFNNGKRVTIVYDGVIKIEKELGTFFTNNTGTEESEFSILKDKTISSITINGTEEIVFKTTTGEEFLMYHKSDCCESVDIEDICGDLNDLIGSPIIDAEEYTRKGEQGACWSSTFTFYNIKTIKGTVTIRWYGESNGYYCETACFEKIVRR